MSQEPMGKKRRKEIREAINMRSVVRKAELILAGIVVGGSIIDIIVAQYMVHHYDITNQWAMMVPTFVAFALLFVVMFQYNHFSRINRKYKKFLIDHNVTKQDMKDLEAESKGE